MSQDQNLIKQALLTYLSGDDVSLRNRSMISRDKSHLFTMLELSANAALFVKRYMSLSNRPIVDIINYIIDNPGQLVFEQGMLAARNDMTMSIYNLYKAQIVFNLNKLQENENISIDDIISNLSPEELNGDIISQRFDLTRDIFLSNLPIMNVGIIPLRLLEPDEPDTPTNPGDNTP